MPRVKRGVTKRHRHKKILSEARGFQASSSRNYKWAKEAVMHAWTHAYRDRRDRKGIFRSLWITRINAACRANGLTYSQAVNGWKKAGVEVDRKMLADLAVNDPEGFQKLLGMASQALAS